MYSLGDGNDAVKILSGLILGQITKSKRENSLASAEILLEAPIMELARRGQEPKTDKLYIY